MRLDFSILPRLRVCLHGDSNRYGVLGRVGFGTGNSSYTTGFQIRSVPTKTGSNCGFKRNIRTRRRVVSEWRVLPPLPLYSRRTEVSRISHRDRLVDAEHLARSPEVSRRECRRYAYLVNTTDESVGFSASFASFSRLRNDSFLQRPMRRQFM